MEKITNGKIALIDNFLQTLSIFSLYLRKKEHEHL